MKARKIGYWIATAITAWVFLSGGVAYLIRAPFVVPGILELGYPVYLLTILGFWKFLGGIAVLVPRFPRLKEWAYAGFVFDLTGASASHAFAGKPIWKVIVPLVITGIVFASWALRPASKKLTGSAGGRQATIT
jgi:uncharacterized membrane protein YphA (DoxX/SURF4 family)